MNLKNGVIVSFSLETKRYLGKPYKDCNPAPNYTKRLVLNTTQKIIKQI